MLPTLTLCKMASTLIDPHNHAPAVTPDDVWGDCEAIQTAASGARLVLPAKKIKPARAAQAGGHGEGLRIGEGALPRPAADPAIQLEVREFDIQVLRLLPEISSPTKVPRLPVSQVRPVGADRNQAAQGEGKEWGAARKHSARWLVGSGLGVVAVVVLGLLLLPLINESNADHPRPGQTGLVLDKEESTEGLASLNNLVARQAEAEQLFRAYASAATVEEILPLLRDAAAVEPLIRSQRRPALIAKSWLPPDGTLWNVVASDGLPFAQLEGSLPDFAKFSAYCLLAGNQLQLDWKATTGYGTATFGELAQGQGAPAEIRVKILSAKFYTAHYPEAEFQSYQLLAPDESQAIWGYTRRGAVVDGLLGKLFWSGEILDSPPEQQKVTLRLAHGPEGSLPNQWVIEEMLHHDWIHP